MVPFPFRITDPVYISPMVFLASPATTWTVLRGPDLRARNPLLVASLARLARVPTAWGRLSTIPPPSR
jgi:hypothetical protein